MSTGKISVRPDLVLDPAAERDAAVLAFLDRLPAGTLATVIKEILAHTLTHTDPVELSALVGGAILRGRSRSRKTKASGRAKRQALPPSERGQDVAVGGSQQLQTGKPAAVSEVVKPSTKAESGAGVKNARALFGGMTTGTSF